MESNVICIHNPFLYEDTTVNTSWLPGSGDVEYHLERRFEEEFDAVITGWPWYQIQLEDADWAAIEAAIPDWNAVHDRSVPSAGYTWMDVEDSGSTWETLEQNPLTWKEFSQLAPNLTIYRGPDGDIVPREEGYNWRELNSYTKPWSELEGQFGSWEEFHRFCGPSDGMLWRDLELAFTSWEGFQEASLTWEELGDLPSDALYSQWQHIGYTNGIPFGAKRVTYRLTATDQDGNRRSYTTPLLPIHMRLREDAPGAFEFPQYLYENWPATVKWRGMDGATAYILERRFEQGFDQPPQGYNWLDFQKEVDSWQELQDTELTWRQLEFSIPDRRIYYGKKGHFEEERSDGTYIGFNDFMPDGAKYVACRVKAINDIEESGYYTTPLTKVKPRLKGPHPERFELGNLYLWQSIPVLWKEQVGAIWYVLERSLEIPNGSSGTQRTAYEVICDSRSKALPLKRTLSDGVFVGLEDTLPKNAIRVSYRVKGYNEIEQSQYLKTDYLHVHRNYTQDSLNVQVKAGKPYFVEIGAQNVESFDYTPLTFQYDATALQLTDFAAQTAKADLAVGAVDGTDLKITSIKAGEVRFESGEAVPDGRCRSGLVTVMRFGGEKNALGTIKLQ